MDNRQNTNPWTPAFQQMRQGPSDGSFFIRNTSRETNNINHTEEPLSSASYAQAFTRNNNRNTEIPVFQSETATHLLPITLLDEINYVGGSTPQPILNTRSTPMNFMRQPLAADPLNFYNEPEPLVARPVFRSQNPFYDSPSTTYPSQLNHTNSFNHWLTQSASNINYEEPPPLYFQNNEYRNSDMQLSYAYTAPQSVTENTYYTGRVSTPFLSEAAMSALQYFIRPSLGNENCCSDEPLVQEQHILKNILDEITSQERAPRLTPINMNNYSDPLPPFTRPNVRMEYVNGNTDLSWPHVEPPLWAPENLNGPPDNSQYTLSNDSAINCVSMLNSTQNTTENAYMIHNGTTRSPQGFPLLPERSTRFNGTEYASNFNIPNEYLFPPRPTEMLQSPPISLPVPPQDFTMDNDRGAVGLPDERLGTQDVSDMLQQYRMWQKMQDYKQSLAESYQEQGAASNGRGPSTSQNLQYGHHNDVIIWALPKTLGIYTVGQKIGRGSFSDVYLATDQAANTIAIKSYHILRKIRETCPKAVNEIAFLKLLRHPNIVTYICADAKKQYMYLGMDYSPYGSLRNFMKPHTWIPEEIVQLVLKDLLSALCYLHSMKIFHGSIKPENIMVIDPKFFKIKLMDFVNAKVSTKGLYFYKKAGSCFYLAPEIHLGYPADFKSDLYSIGILMYEMLYGDLPYPIEITRKEFLIRLLEKRPITLPSDSRVLSTSCSGLMLNLLGYEKHKRYSGRNLVGHEFVRGAYVQDEQDHFRKAYECYLRSTELADQRKYGEAYIESTEAVLHLQIHMDEVSDMALEEHVVLKTEKYKRFTQILHKRIMSGYIGRPLLAPKKTEELRTLLLVSPKLLEGYDFCIQGEMYFRLNEPCAKEYMRKGLDIIFEKLISEPHGYRKELLTEKVKQWLQILNLGDDN